MDLIDRQAAIDVFRKLADDEWNKFTGTSWADGYESAIEILEDLPSAQRWTPVSEKLPKEDENVLVAVHFRGLERTEAGWNDRIKESWYVDIASHIDGNWTSYSDEYKVAKSRHEVIAWMPLPEPYKGEAR